MVTWEEGGEEGRGEAVATARDVRVRVPRVRESREKCFAVPARKRGEPRPRARFFRSPAPRTRDRTVRARSRGVPRPRAVCRALRDDASSESRALVCSAVSGVTRFWQQVKVSRVFSGPRGGVSERTTPTVDLGASERVTCAVRWKSRQVDLGDDVRVGQRDTCSRDDDTTERFEGSRRRDSPAQHERPGR